MFLTYASNANFVTKGKPMILLIYIFWCGSGIIQIGVSWTGTVTAISMESWNMASFVTYIIKYLVTKSATCHGHIFIMLQSNVITKTIGQLVFLVTILALYMWVLERCSAKAAEDSKLVSPQTIRKKGKIINWDQYSIHYWHFSFTPIILNSTYFELDFSTKCLL